MRPLLPPLSLFVPVIIGGCTRPAGSQLPVLDYPLGGPFRWPCIGHILPGRNLQQRGN